MLTKPSLKQRTPRQPYQTVACLGMPATHRGKLRCHQRLALPCAISDLSINFVKLIMLTLKTERVNEHVLALRLLILTPSLLCL